MPAKKKTSKKTKTSSKKKGKAIKKVKKIKEKIIGRVEHIFDKIGVITSTLKNPLKAGDVIHIKGHTTDFVQTVDSLQIEHKDVLKAKKGDGIGLKIKDVCRDTDTIYLADKKTALAVKNGTYIKPSAIPAQVPAQTVKAPSTDKPQQTKFMAF